MSGGPSRARRKKRRTRAARFRVIVHRTFVRFWVDHQGFDVQVEAEDDKAADAERTPAEVRAYFHKRNWYARMLATALKRLRDGEKP